MKAQAGDRALIVASPMSGWCDSLDDSPDQVFRDRLLGDGVSIDPTEGRVLAPFDGQVLTLPGSMHAINLRAKCGAELLIHVGIDTVHLAGQGFAAHVAQGDFVRQGESLLSFELESVLRGAGSLRSPVLLLRNEKFKVQRIDYRGPIKAGDALFEVLASAAGEGAPPPAVASKGPDTIERSITSGLPHGIHARPAAAMVAAVKDLDAAVEIRAAGKTADARSPVALMTLGLAHGHSVTVAANGPQAEEAVSRVIAVLEPIPDAAEGSARLPHESPTQEHGPAPAAGSVLPAQPATTGLAIGVAVQWRAWQAPSAGDARSPVEERSALRRALAVVNEYLSDLAESQQGTGRDIARAHIALLQDPSLIGVAETLIDAGQSGPSAWGQAVADVAQALRQLGDRRMRERAADLEDIDRRVQRALAGEAPREDTELPEDAIILAGDLLPSQLLEMDHSRIAGICTVRGGTTSHVAILAASLEIPMLVAAGENILRIADGTLLGVDADYGELQVHADHGTAAAFRLRISGARERRQKELAAAMEECRTTDGTRIRVNANIASISDALTAVERGADGCGLLRTEFVFMDRARAPGTTEQLRVYQKISDTLGDRPMVVRTLDAGGDKPIGYMEQGVEQNPALGVRGIRLSLSRPAMLESQLDAVLQVQRSGAHQIMIPMVTSVDEVRIVRQMIDRLLGLRDNAGDVKLGVMIETPSAALIVDKLIDIVDFFSIGTNDLTQYVLAMDRGESSLAGRIDALHPAVLRLISQAADAARAAGKPVAVCGGAAGDPFAAPVLLGLGVRELSMVTGAIARQKARIREWSIADCAGLAGKALLMNSAHDIRAMARKFVGRRESSAPASARA